MSLSALLAAAGSALLAWLNRSKLAGLWVTLGRAAGTTTEEPVVLIFRDLRAVAQRCQQMSLDAEADKIRTLAAEILAVEANLANAQQPQVPQ